MDLLELVPERWVWRFLKTIAAMKMRATTPMTITALIIIWPLFPEPIFGILMASSPHPEVNRHQADSQVRFLREPCWCKR
ncbi:MAG: hypothetical protein FD126_1252 [Elusimicrobia bacterium]|nr:MAG: hypothetical protein FD126_1252 [Elusimicrobiota bacterium]